MNSEFLIFAASAETLEYLRIAAAAVPIAGTVIGAFLWLLRRYVRLIHERERLRRTLREAEDELKQLRNNPGAERVNIEDQLAESQHERERLEKTFNKVNQDLRIAQQMKGLTWMRPPTGLAAKFIPLHDRRVPILAVLNLKGGVGKTTLTANLGVAFARTGWRVLLVDLDLQASLTSLYLPGEQIQQLSDSQRLVQNYFEKATGGGEVQHLDYVHTASEPRVSVIGSSDALAYAELNLTVYWVLRPHKRDVRLLLRELLHDTKLISRFDIVLIDCPPLLNVSCVNALAAADYVLIPVMPSKLVTDRVPAMVAWLRELRRNLNSDLKIAGVAANRTFRDSQFTHQESNLWSAMLAECHANWGEKLRMCATIIPQKVEIRDAENERRPLRAADEMFARFRELAVELSEQLPESSRPFR